MYTDRLTHSYNLYIYVCNIPKKVWDFLIEGQVCLIWTFLSISSRIRTKLYFISSQEKNEINGKSFQLKNKDFSSHN